jgi:hypothetical protein
MLTVAVVLTRKEQDGEKWLSAVLRRADEAEAAGRRFSTYNAKLGWDETECAGPYRDESCLPGGFQQASKQAEANTERGWVDTLLTPVCAWRTSIFGANAW